MTSLILLKKKKKFSRTNMKFMGSIIWGQPARLRHNFSKKKKKKKATPPPPQTPKQHQYEAFKLKPCSYTLIQS